MGLSGAERGQSIQIGAVLLFGILIIFLATYQAFVVPSQNEEVEFKHSERVQSQLQELRNAIVSSASRETSTSVAIDLGTTYPSRIIALNPPPTSGTLRTVGTSNGSVALAIDNATAVDAETDDFWDGTNRSYSTGLLTYNPDYNLLSQMPTTVYGNTVLYNAFGEKSLPITGQTMIDGNQLSLFVLNGTLNTGGSGTRTVDVRPVSASEQSILVEPEGSSNMTISFPSRLSAEQWRSVLESELNQSVGDERYVERIQGSDGPGKFHNITITLESSATYRMRMVKVGVGTNVEAEGAAYLTVVDGAGASVESGGTTQITLEVRDAFNNPVSSVRVNASASAGSFVDDNKDSGVNGRVTFTYEASGVDGGTTQQLNFSLSIDPGSNFDPSTAENVTMSLSIAQQGGGRDPAYTISFDTGAIGTYPGLTCTATNCTYNDSADTDSTFNLTAVTNPTVSGASVDFALNTTEYGSLTAEDDTTSDNGRANATFEPTANGTITAFVASGSSSDSIPIRLVMSSKTGNNPAAIQFNNFQGFTADPDANEFTLEQISVQDADNDDDLDRVEYQVTDNNGNVVASRTIDNIPGDQYQAQQPAVTLSGQVQRGETYTLTGTVYDADGNFDSQSLSDTVPNAAAVVEYNNDGSANGPQGGTTGASFSVTNTGNNPVTITSVAVDTDDNSAEFLKEEDGGTGQWNREVFIGTDTNGYLEAGDSGSDKYTLGSMTSLNQNAIFNGGSSATISVYQFQTGGPGASGDPVSVNGDTVTVRLRFSDGTTETIQFTG